MKLKFVKPELKHETLVELYKKEHFEHGETTLHGSALLDQRDDYAAWVEMVHNNQNADTVVNSWVPSSTFLVMDETEKEIIGMVDIRHELNDFLRNYGGNIGYGVKPSKRKQGYATMILRMAIQYSKDLGLKGVMVSCDIDNEASRKTILACGGKLEKELQREGQIIQIYWIQTS